MLTPQELQHAEYIAQLLASAPISERVAEQIIDNLENFSSEDLQKLIIILQKAASTGGSAILELDRFVREQEQYWNNIEAEQQKAADQLLQTHGDQEQLANVRKKLAV